MPITAISSRELNRHTGRAKKAASTGPVFITDHGNPTHVLLTIEDYHRLTRGGPSIIDLIGMPPGTEDIDVEFPRCQGLARAADFS